MYKYYHLPITVIPMVGCGRKNSLHSLGAHNINQYFKDLDHD
jgi:hypothetical protein